MKGPMAHLGIEGPVYADRVNSRLTFRDWEHWTEDDRHEWREEFKKRAPKRVVLDHMIRLGIVSERFS